MFVKDIFQNGFFFSNGHEFLSENFFLRLKEKHVKVL